MAIPVLTVQQMRTWENASWAAGQREEVVIAHVGRWVAATILRHVGASNRVLLLAGRGNNGNDLRAAIPHLKTLTVDLLDVTSPAEAQSELERLLQLKPALIVDGLFGIGLNRPLARDWCQLIETINTSALPVLAVDVPSGLNADSGGNFGAVVLATHTLTVGAPKQGLIQEAAAESVGHLEVAEDVSLLPGVEELVGQPQATVAGRGTFRTFWTTAADFAGFPPARKTSSHKGSYGHLLIVAGSLGYHGAALLAARAAGAARPGLVTVVTSPAAYPALAAQLAFAMVRPWSQPLNLPAKTTALLVGPGLAGPDVPDWLRAQLIAWWQELPLPLLVDASALDWLAKLHREWCERLPGKALAPASESMNPHAWLSQAPPPDAIRVVTPHLGEAARWFPQNTVCQDRFSTAERLSQATGIAVVKGSQTLVRARDGSIYVNSTGNPGLAQGGTGDVLAGFTAGLLAQPALRVDPLRTVRYAVWEHGSAGDRLESIRRNWTAEDLAAEIGR
jgi:NAD(P)H-hydrate epimerase